MSVKCEIVVNRDGVVCLSGEIISGTVQITLNNDKSFKAIYLHMYGECISDWAESRGGTARFFKGKLIYLSSKTYFFGSENGNVRKILKGAYTFTFSCDLPSCAASSIEQLDGYIRYKAIVYFEHPLKPDLKFTKPFNVLKPLNLNNNNNNNNNNNLWSKPIEIIELIDFHRMDNNKSHDLLLKVKLPIAGYVPRQMIPISLDVDNKSIQKIKYFKIHLYQSVNHFDDDQANSRKSETILFETITGCCRGNNSIVFKKYLIIPPNLPPTFFNNIIEIEYFIKIKAYVGKTFFNPKIFIPITIGTIPINNTLATMIEPTRNEQNYDDNSNNKINSSKINGKTSKKILNLIFNYKN